eukprot:6198020-Pleurochrysis_carterae.AAC.1
MRQDCVICFRRNHQLLIAVCERQCNVKGYCRAESPSIFQNRWFTNVRTDRPAVRARRCGTRATMLAERLGAMRPSSSRCRDSPSCCERG